MKIYMAPCGVGLGHITRCEPIARELARRGAEVVFSTYGDGVEYAHKLRLRLVKTVPIYLRVREDGSVDFKSTATRSGLSLGMRTFIRQVLAEIRNLKSFKPDLAFSDSRASTLLAAKLLGIPTLLMLNQYRVNIIRKPSSARISIGDRIFFFIANVSWLFFRTLLQGLWSIADLIIIPDFPYPYTVSIGNLAIPKRYSRKVRLVGPVVGARPSQIAQTPEDLRKRMGLAVSKPLVYAAVSGPKIERRYLANLLEAVIKESTFNAQFVMSRGEASGSKVMTVNKKLLIFDWLTDEQQYDLFKACDLVVCRAGHGTITKAMTFGKPMILVPIPDHTEQYGNARQVIRLGLGKILYQHKVNAENLDQIISEILDSETFADRAREMSLFSEGLNTVSDIAELVLNRIHRDASASTSTTQA